MYLKTIGILFLFLVLFLLFSGVKINVNECGKCAEIPMHWGWPTKRPPNSYV
tara:strand:- start:826 stop:981 length:156 start_codon:yes stop_codon:yes gene_type:complete